MSDQPPRAPGLRKSALEFIVEPVHTVLAYVRSPLGPPLVALAALATMFFAWSCERQARLRQTLDAERVREHTAEEVSRLQADAATALREADQYAQAARDLELQRQKLEREAVGLRDRLTSLHNQELARLREVATLPTAGVAARVATYLGDREASKQWTENAAPMGAGGSKTVGLDARPSGSDPSQAALSGTSPAVAQLALSDQDIRRLATALVELDSCREQRQALDLEATNCRQQADLQSKIVSEKDSTIAGLRSALTDKDEIQARREDQHRVELKAARGTWRSRFLRAFKYFASGIALGVALR